MRPMLPPEKKRKMVSFMMSQETVKILENMFSTYKEKIFRRFTKTDLFEIAIKNLASDLTKKNMLEVYKLYIDNKEE